MSPWGLLFSGNANNGTNAGFGYANTNNAPSNTNTNIGSRQYLSRKIIRRRQTLPHGKKTSIEKRIGRETDNPEIDKQRKMKRFGNLYQKVCDLDNIRLAYQKARKGKRNRYGVKLFERDVEGNLLALQAELQNKTYKTSEYSVFKIYEPKEREIYRLPFRDRVVHHAIMNVLEPIWVSIFSTKTYSCIKKRGIHGAEKDVKRDLIKDPAGTRYCLKGDIKKYYPSIDHDTLKGVVRRKIKDPDLLWLIDDIIDSAPGVPIGNYLSQYLANLYLAYFDHDIKTFFGLRDNDKVAQAYFRNYVDYRMKGNEADIFDVSAMYADWIRAVNHTPYYYRYADDFVVLSDDKAYLQVMIDFIGLYLARELKLTVKQNWQVFPVEARGIDFVGYVFRHTFTRLRKSIKKNFFRKVHKAVKADPGISQKRLIHTVCSYYGWCLHSNCKHLLTVIFNRLTNEIKLCIPKSVHI